MGRGLFVNKLASLEATLVRNYDPPTRSLTGVRCRATSVAKNLQEDKKENKRESDKKNQREKGRENKMENAIEQVDDKEMERERNKEKERQDEKEKEVKQEGDKLYQTGDGKKIETENVKMKEQTRDKKTETKVKGTDENSAEKAKMCQMCQETFTSSQIYREHKGKKHIIKCPLQKTCKLRFVVNYYKNLHLYRAHKIGSRPWESLRPKKEESVTKLVDASLFGPDKTFFCKKCKTDFHNQDQQIHHQRLSHNYSCKKCDRSYIVEAAFKDHKATHVQKTIASPTKAATQPPLIAVEKHAFLCGQCEKKFTDGQQLRKHETERHEARCKATECNLTFGTHFTTRCIPRN